MSDTQLKLSAQDADDVCVISMLLQDAVVTASEIRWDSNSYQLMIMAQRYTWDRAGTDDESCGRVNSRICLTGAGGIAIQNMAVPDSGSGHHTLSLLAVRFAEDDGFLEFDFADRAALRVTLNAGWRLSLTDLGEPWPAPCPIRHTVD